MSNQKNSEKYLDTKAMAIFLAGFCERSNLIHSQNQRKALHEAVTLEEIRNIFCIQLSECQIQEFIDALYKDGIKIYREETSRVEVIKQINLSSTPEEVLKTYDEDFGDLFCDKVLITILILKLATFFITSTKNSVDNNKSEIVTSYCIKDIKRELKIRSRSGVKFYGVSIPL